MQKNKFLILTIILITALLTTGSAYEVINKEDLRFLIKEFVIANLPEPVGEVVHTIKGASEDSKVGILLWLDKKIDHAISRNDFGKVERYQAIYTCLGNNDCQNLYQYQQSYKFKLSEDAQILGALVDTIIVLNNQPEKVTSTIVLEEGQTYTIKASGITSPWGNLDEGVDAVWCYHEGNCGAEGQSWNHLRIDGQGMSDIAGSQIPYNPSHVYQVQYQGKGDLLAFWMLDAVDSSEDNRGSILVEIFQ